MKLLNELSRKRAEEKFGWHAQHAPAKLSRSMRVTDTIVFTFCVLLLGMFVYTLL